ncbi:radical SAM protein [bacterium]|nr:MAG: radical SAM protein [bacterium]
MGRGPTKKYHKALNADYVKGTLTCLKASTIKRVINNDFPNVLNIEPTNRCNLKCVYCPRTRASKGVGLMDWKLYTRIIDEASKYKKLLMLNFHKDGESFLHPRFLEMVRYAKKKNVAKTIHINTNALSWTDKLMDEIIDSGIDDITVSIDAARATTFKKHKGVNCLSKVERNVRLLLEKRDKRGLHKPFIRVKIMEFAEVSKDEIAEFFARWEGIADFVQVTGIHSWGGAIKNVKVTDENSQSRYPCVIMWYALVINWNGEATVCSVDWNTEIKVGDAKKNTLHEIWNSKAIKDVRRYQIEKEYDNHKICRDCVVWVSIGDLTSWLTKKSEFYE